MMKSLILTAIALASATALADQKRPITVTSDVPACYQYQDTALLAAIADVEKQAKEECGPGVLWHSKMNVIFGGSCRGPIVTAQFVCYDRDVK